MRISMYNELVMIGLMWSREVIYEEWNSFFNLPRHITLRVTFILESNIRLFRRLPYFNHTSWTPPRRHTLFKLLLRQKYISLRRWRITLINGLGDWSRLWRRYDCVEWGIGWMIVLMPISTSARGRRRTIIFVPPQARCRMRPNIL